MNERRIARWTRWCRSGLALLLLLAGPAALVLAQETSGGGGGAGDGAVYVSTKSYLVECVILVGLVGATLFAICRSSHRS